LFSGIFNLRAAKLLSRYADLKVVHLRAWLPGRKSIEVSTWEGLSRITVAIPQVPILQDMSFALYRSVGWMLLRRFLEDCDLIHSVGIDFAAIVGAAWAEKAGVHHVVQVIGSDLNAVEAPQRLFLTLADRVHAVACNSQALVEEFRRRFPAVSNVCKVWRGVDLAKFHPAGEMEGPQAKRKPVRFLFLGGFPTSRHLAHGMNNKGGETLMLAWRAGEEELHRAEASLLIANLGTQAHRIARWRSELRYPRQVDLQGAISPADVPKFLRAADVVLVPSMQEGLPNVAVEASACGRPVFGSRVGGIPEAVNHGETGLLLQPGDAAAWELALVEYAKTPTALQAMGAAARTRMEQFFDSLLYPDRMKEVYALALNQPLLRGALAGN
jgi:glycosyltransferase involved in cell wall biosynthesis